MRAENTFGQPTRSEQLRQRRAQTNREGKSQPRKTATRTFNAAPVTVRAYQSNVVTPLRPVKSNQVRKQMYYSLGASGAEMRLPALPILNLGSRIISGMVIGLVLLALYVIAFSSEFQVNQLDVKGIQRLTVSDFEAILGATGEQIINIDPADMAERLTTAFPELASANVTVGFPAEIHINVVERQPVLTWNVGDTTYWVDENGFILPPRGEVSGLQAITADALPFLLPDAESTEPEAAQTEAPTSTAYWGRQMDPNLLKTMIDLPGKISIDSNLVYNSLNGLGWKDARGWDVYIGSDLGNIDQKLTIYESLIASLDQQAIKPSELVSVEFINAPFYK